MLEGQAAIRSSVGLAMGGKYWVEVNESRGGVDQFVQGGKSSQRKKPLPKALDIAAESPIEIIPSKPRGGGSKGFCKCHQGGPELFMEEKVEPSSCLIFKTRDG